MAEVRPSSSASTTNYSLNSCLAYVIVSIDIASVQQLRRASHPIRFLHPGRSRKALVKVYVSAISSTTRVPGPLRLCRTFILDSIFMFSRLIKSLSTEFHCFNTHSLLEEGSGVVFQTCPSKVRGVQLSGCIIHKNLNWVQAQSLIPLMLKASYHTVCIAQSRTAQVLLIIFRSPSVE